MFAWPRPRPLEGRSLKSLVEEALRTNLRLITLASRRQRG